MFIEILLKKGQLPMMPLSHQSKFAFSRTNFLLALILDNEWNNWSINYYQN